MLTANYGVSANLASQRLRKHAQRQAYKDRVAKIPLQTELKMPPDQESQADFRCGCATE